MTGLDLLTFASAAAPQGAQHAPLLSLASLAALVTISILEIVLGIDNVVFIAILTGRLPEEKQAKARNLGLILAGVMRLVLLGLAYWITRLETPFATVFGVDLSGKSMILLGGGLFLIAKATWEIHHLIEGGHGDEKPSGVASMGKVLLQVLALDLVFSIDSVITAVGMTDHYVIMAMAVMIAVGVMLFFAGPIGRFVNKHPSMKTLALAFLVLIGVLLVADGIGEHFNRGYVYFVMGFALIVELINMKAGARRKRARAAA